MAKLTLQELLTEAREYEDAGDCGKACEVYREAIEAAPKQEGRILFGGTEPTAQLTLNQALALIVDINEAMYPDGNPEAEHSADTTAEVARLLREAGLTPGCGLLVRRR